MKHKWRYFAGFCGAAVFCAVCIQTASTLQADEVPEQTHTVSFAETESGVTASNELIYGIGSVSKVFTAAAVMQLVEEGLVSLDTPVVRYIPDFRMQDERYRKITVRMLLDHSSGIMGTSDRNILFNGVHNGLGYAELLSRLAGQRLKAEPGAFSVYSNDGFTLAELLVERVSGMSFSRYIAERICGPAEMKNTVTPDDMFERLRQAPAFIPGTYMQLPPESLHMIGAGGILSTAEDMCRFARLFMGTGTSVLSAQSIREMGTAQTNNPLFTLEGPGLIQYGLGWDNVESWPFSGYGIKALDKGGDTGVYGASLVVLPDENLSAAVLSSGGSSTLNKMLADELLLSALRERGTPVPPLPEDELMESPLSGIPVYDAGEFGKYEGLYISQDPLYLRFSDGSLYLSTLDKRRNVTHEYISDGTGRFVSQNGAYISASGELLFAEGGTRGKTVLSFSRSGEDIYICMTTQEKRAGIGEYIYTVPLAQKAEPVSVPESAASAWRARDKNKYYLTGELPSSSLWLTPVTTVRIPAAFCGYFRNTRVTGPDTAESFVRIPLMAGRDLCDYRFFRKNDSEYMDVLLGGSSEQSVKRRYISEDAMYPMPSRSFTAEIGADENSRWFTIPAEYASMSIAVSLLPGGTYYVYRSDDTPIASSIVENVTVLPRLPENGKLVLIGNDGDRFGIELKP